MATWDEFISRAYGEIGTAYQQILTQGAVTPHYYTPQPQQDAQPSQINPEYSQMDKLYAEQETERERIAGITEASYEPTNEDWQEYGRYLDEMRQDAPESYNPHHEMQMEPER